MANWSRNVIQILVLGAGLIGARHAKSVQQHPACTLVGVVEPNSALHIDPSISYYTDVADVAHPVQAAIIATPTHLHAEHGFLQHSAAGIFWLKSLFQEAWHRPKH